MRSLQILSDQILSGRVDSGWINVDGSNISSWTDAELLQWYRQQKQETWRELIHPGLETLMVDRGLLVLKPEEFPGQMCRCWMLSDAAREILRSFV